MQTVKSFIDDLGGTVKVAEALGAPVSTVSGWNLSNTIPHWRVASLEALAKKQRTVFPDELRGDRAA